MATKDGDVADKISRDELQLIADEMTMGDIWRARKEADGDQASLGMLGFYYAARRTELIAQDVDFLAFLDRVGREDFKAVNAIDRSKSDQPAAGQGDSHAGVEMRPGNG